MATTEVHTLETLWSLCADAAAYAVRPPYTYSDRADCAADIFGDIMAAVARTSGQVPRLPDRDHETRPASWAAVSPYSVRRGRCRREDVGRDVVAYIDWAETVEAPRRVESVLPLQSDKRFQWTAVRNRASDWRRREDTRREYEALLSGKDRTETPRDECPTDYLTSGANQDRNRARHAATLACRDLRVSTGTTTDPSPIWCVLYQWARDIDAREAASELGIGDAAMRQRVSRAGIMLRDAVGIVRLAEFLTGGRIIERTEGDETTLTYALADDSRDAAHHWAGDIAEHWQDARDRTRSRTLKDSGPPPVTTLRTDPDPDATERRAAAEAAREQRRAHATRVLGAMSRRPVHAGTGAVEDRTGRTAGKPPERWAAREVRLGPDVVRN